jgi:hypothetical protein
MKACEWDVTVWLHSFIPSTLDGCEWWTLRTGRSITRVNTQVLVGYEAVSDAFGEISVGRSGIRTLTSQPVVIRNADCAVKWNERYVGVKIKHADFVDRTDTESCNNVLLNCQLMNTIRNSKMLQPLIRVYNWYVLAVWVNKIVSWYQNAGQSHNISTDNKSFETVE